MWVVYWEYHEWECMVARETFFSVSLYCDCNESHWLIPGTLDIDG